jgi:hypothetical protein
MTAKDLVKERDAFDRARAQETARIVEDLIQKLLSL